MKRNFFFILHDGSCFPKGSPKNIVFKLTEVTKTLIDEENENYQVVNVKIFFKKYEH